MLSHQTKPISTYQSARAFWDARADMWLSYARDPTSYYFQRTGWVVQLICRHVEVGRVLDMGCGVGLLVRRLSARGFDAYGADISPIMVEAAIQEARDGLPDVAQRFRTGDDTDIPFAGPFDVVTAIGLFPYVAQFELLVRKIRDILRPGGVVVASCVNRFSLYNGTQLARYLNPCVTVRNRQRILANLFQTGLWSAGLIDKAERQQCYSAAAFDALLRRSGFEVIDAMDLYSVLPATLDGDPLQRSAGGRFVARRFGWSHIGVYRDRRVRVGERNLKDRR